MHTSGKVFANRAWVVVALGDPGLVNHSAPRSPKNALWESARSRRKKTCIKMYQTSPVHVYADHWWVESQNGANNLCQNGANNLCKGSGTKSWRKHTETSVVRRWVSCQVVANNRMFISFGLPVLQMNLIGTCGLHCSLALNDLEETAKPNECDTWIYSRFDASCYE